MTYNPYRGMESPFFPGYDKPSDNCGCGAPEACGAEHKAAITVETVTRVSKSGQKSSVVVARPIGRMYHHTASKAFAAWDGHLALNDLHAPKVQPYQPPALPYVCDRPLSGSDLCSMNGGRCNP